MRCQVEVRDPAKLPLFAEMTDEELVIFEVGFQLESVVSPGWYGGSAGTKRVNKEHEGNNTSGVILSI